MGLVKNSFIYIDAFLGPTVYIFQLKRNQDMI